MMNLITEMAQIERQARSHRVSIRHICQLAGVAPSNWARWKSQISSPTFATWAKIEQAVSTALIQHQPSAPDVAVVVPVGAEQVDLLTKELPDRPLPSNIIDSVDGAGMNAPEPTGTN
jgi:hypothetical protein